MNLQTRRDTTDRLDTFVKFFSMSAEDGAGDGSRCWSGLRSSVADMLQDAFNIDARQDDGKRSKSAAFRTQGSDMNASLNVARGKPPQLEKLVRLYLSTRARIILTFRDYETEESQRDREGV